MTTQNIKRIKTLIKNEIEKISDLKERELARFFFEDNLECWDLYAIVRTLQERTPTITIMGNELKTPYADNKRAIQKDLINSIIGHVLGEYRAFMSFLEHSIKSGFDDLEYLKSYLEQSPNLGAYITGAPLIHRDEFIKMFKPEILEDMTSDILAQFGEGIDEDELKEGFDENRHDYGELTYNADAYNGMSDHNIFYLDDAINNGHTSIIDIANHFKSEYDFEQFHEGINNDLEHLHPLKGFKKKELKK